MNLELTDLIQGKSHLKRENYRFFVSGNYISLLSCIGHLVYIGIFLYLQITFLAVFNIFSTVIWIFCYLLNRRGYHRASIYIGFSELIINSIITTYFVGWEAGFHIYIICSIPFIFYFPSGHYIRKFLWCILIIALYIGLNIFFKTHIPLKNIDPFLTQILKYYNLMLMLIFIALASYYYSRAARDAESAFEKEYERSELLLLNILPGKIADQLKKNANLIAEKHNEVSILFLDIAGFTQFSSQISAEKLVNILNDIFSIFDELVEKYGLEKIKTIGDSYMVASGLPDKCQDHAEKIIRFALDMREAFKKYCKNANIPLNFRIGINSGPVVAGVIGKKKFIYDLWGDTVNTASRMESNGLPGEIQISEKTFKLIENIAVCDERGTIEIKGKGAARTFLLKNMK